MESLSKIEPLFYIDQKYPVYNITPEYKSKTVELSAHNFYYLNELQKLI